jgi:hypothetical protein
VVANLVIIPIHLVVSLVYLVLLAPLFQQLVQLLAYPVQSASLRIKQLRLLVQLVILEQLLISKVQLLALHVLLAVFLPRVALSTALYAPLVVT